MRKNRKINHGAKYHVNGMEKVVALQLSLKMSTVIRRHGTLQEYNNSIYFHNNAYSVLFCYPFRKITIDIVCDLSYDRINDHLG